jgi:hypothetical protein
MVSHAYLPGLNTHTAALGLGLSAASFFVFGNVGVARMGLMQANKAPQRARFGIRPEQALQFWEYSYDLGMCVPSFVSCFCQRLISSRMQSPLRADGRRRHAQLPRGLLYDKPNARPHVPRCRRRLLRPRPGMDLRRQCVHSSIRARLLLTVHLQSCR